MSNDSIIVQCPSCKTKNRVPRIRLEQGGICGKCKQPLPVVPTKPVNAGSASFETEVIQSSIPVLVDFWAAWCGPCRMIAPDLEKIAQTYAGQVKVVKIDTDKNQDLAARYSIQAIPSLLVFKGGQLIEQQAGALPYSHLQALVERIMDR